MTNTPRISINIDPCNPGQYFACCGLLVLADHIDPEAKGWFECPADTPRIGRFHVASKDNDIMNKIITALDECIITADEEYENYFKKVVYNNPVYLEFKVPEKMTICLDWWLEDNYKDNSSSRKCWAGTQKIKENFLETWKKQLQKIRKKEFSMDSLFELSCEGKTINYDPRSSLTGSLSVGFSPNKMGLDTFVFPYVEYLCMIGLQFVRPRREKHKELSYFIWSSPMPLSVSMSPGIGKYEIKGNSYGYRQIVASEFGKNTPCTFATQIS